MNPTPQPQSTQGGTVPHQTSNAARSSSSLLPVTALLLEVEGVQTPWSPELVPVSWVPAVVS